MVLTSKHSTITKWCYSCMYTAFLLMQVNPKGDLVLAKVAEAEEKTTGGVLLPNSAQKKPTSGRVSDPSTLAQNASCTFQSWRGVEGWRESQQHLQKPAGDIVAVGDGKVGEVTQTFDLGVGQTILYSKFGIGATDLSVQGALHVLIREDDVIGTLPHSGATAADVPELKPAADRVLIKVTPSFKVSVQRPSDQVISALLGDSCRTCLGVCRLAVRIKLPRCILEVAGRMTVHTCIHAQPVP